MADAPRARRASAAAVSRVLADAGFDKSETHTTRIRGWRNSSPGFRASNDRTYDPELCRSAPTGVVHVEWVSGDTYRSTGADVVRAGKLDRMAEALRGKGYAVEREPSRLVVTRAEAVR